MSTAAVVNVSPSLLADVLTCETKAWTRHVRGYTSRSEAIKAVAGQAVHAGIAAYFDPNPGIARAPHAPLAAFHNVYDPAFAALPADELPDQAYTPTNLHRVLARWLEMHPPHALPWRKVLSVEEAFTSRSFAIDNTTVKLICRPDLVVEDHNGMVRWIDTKTTGWRISDPGWRRALRLSLQVQLYTDAIVQRYGERAILGGWINAIEMRQLPSDPTRKCATHKVAYAECGNEHAKAEMIECLTTGERVEAALRDARHAARQFIEIADIQGNVPAALSMVGTANGACRFCPAADWCEAGRIVDALPHMMAFEPWPIEEGHRA